MKSETEMSNHRNRVQILIAVGFVGWLTVGAAAFGQVSGSPPPLGQPTTGPMPRISGQERVIKVPMPEESRIKKIRMPEEAQVKKTRMPNEGQLTNMDK